jgi:hypothetical protein
MLMDFVFFTVLALVIGLWWMPQLSTNGFHPLLFATLALYPYFSMFYKYVIKTRRNYTPFHLYFYSTLTICALLGYFFGIIFR